ncbi:MAG: hypothetical protein H6667_12550 [Ardenticatenaceae bacterium]|nr:hypothetical protein [Ardenticatenaceae bacterium]
MRRGWGDSLKIWAGSHHQRRRVCPGPSVTEPATERGIASPVVVQALRRFDEIPPR